MKSRKPGLQNSSILDPERQKPVSRAAPPTSKSKAAFRLPPDVSFEKQRLCDAWAYVFRHRVLGELGRILLQELGDGRCHISYEVVGDSSDPMTAQRMAIFKPLGLELARRMEMALGTAAESAGKVEPPPHPPEAKEVIESKLIPCERCGAVVAMLIFAPAATDAGRFEGYARKVYPQYSRLNVPAWVIGPALGARPTRSKCGRPGSRSNGCGPRDSMRASINSPRDTAARGLALSLPPRDGGKGSGNRRHHFLHCPPACGRAEGQRLKYAFW
jgi:hypothetical protein